MRPFLARILAPLLLLACVALAPAQFFRPAAVAPQPMQPALEWYWTRLSPTEAALWHNGTQVGNLDLDTLTYYPRLGVGRWGAPEDAPCEIPAPYQATHREKVKRSGNPYLSGVMGNPANGGKIPHSGLHIRQAKPAAPPKEKSVPKGKPQTRMQDYRSEEGVRIGSKEVPAYDAMASITFVARDGAVADAALKQFQESPELAKARAKYGQRAKSQSYEDFVHTGAAFKLDQDRQFQAGGFVALVSPQAPDANDKAPVKSIYEFSSAAQFASALRDVDPTYDPNPPEPAPLLAADWQPWHGAAAGSLAVTLLLLAGGAVLVRRRAPAL